MIDFNKLYKKTKTAWGHQVAPLVISVLKYIKKGNALDLGCAQGTEALFLASQGFSVTAVDSSLVAINQLNDTAHKNNVTTITTLHSNIVDFIIKKNVYDLIIAINVLYFLDKKKAVDAIKKIQNGLKKGGIVALSLFSTKDPFYNQKKQHRFYTTSEEIAKLFENFEILEHFDGLIEDAGHTSLPEPHQHGAILIIAKKI